MAYGAVPDPFGTIDGTTTNGRCIRAGVEEALGVGAHVSPTIIMGW